MDGTDLIGILDTLPRISIPAERARAAASLVRRVRSSGGTPFFDAAGTAILLWEGEAESVGILGDMNDWETPDPMRRMEGTSLWTWRGDFEPAARLEYLIVTTPEGVGTDPLNPWHSLNGLWKTSELAMPGYHRDPLFTPFADGSRGGFEGLEEHAFHSAILGYPHTLHVQRVGPEPRLALWFQDGLDYIACARAPLILESLVASGDLPPLRAFYVTPPNLHQGRQPDRSTEYGLDPGYVACLCDELVPAAEALGNGRPAERRIVVGDSYGGLISLAIALRRPDRFQAAYGQSSYVSFHGDGLVREAGAMRDIGVHLAFDIGTCERKVGAAFIPPGERDFLEGNRRMKKALEAAGARFHYAERPEGHTWGNWRRGLSWALPLLARDLASPGPT